MTPTIYTREKAKGKLLTREELNTFIEQLENKGDYTFKAKVISDFLNVTLTKLDVKKDFVEWDKTFKHAIFTMMLKKDNEIYIFEFTQSVVNSGRDKTGRNVNSIDCELHRAVTPTLYDVLACLQNYDVGSFEDFCSDFGYDEDSRTAEKTYKAVLKEWEAMERLFTSEELELLQLIQ